MSLIDLYDGEEAMPRALDSTGHVDRSEDARARREWVAMCVAYRVISYPPSDPPPHRILRDPTAHRSTPRDGLGVQTVSEGEERTYRDGRGESRHLHLSHRTPHAGEAPDALFESRWRPREIGMYQHLHSL